jgi:hypothetical protein
VHGFSGCRPSITKSAEKKERGKWREIEGGKQGSAGLDLSRMDLSREIEREKLKEER